MPAEPLLNFPCEFPIKIMGKSQYGFHQAVIAIMRKHLQDFENTEINEVESKKRRYCSLTVNARVMSQQHLDVIYMDLTASEWVLMAL